MAIFPRTPNIEGIRERAGLLLALGIVLALVGLFAIIYSMTATLLSVLVLGWALTIAGIAQVIHAFQRHKAGGMLAELALGILTGVLGVLVLVNPAAGAMSLTLL